MTDPAEDGDRFDDTARELFEVVFRSYIENGAIEIGTRSADEIIGEFREVISDDVAQPDFEWRPIFDHRAKLLERAAAEATDGDANIAATLYATWLEHFVNGILALTFLRRGYNESTITPLLRELRLPTKASALWEIAGLHPIGDQNLRLIEQLLAFRNSFVHYKWKVVPEADEKRSRDQLRSTLSQMDAFTELLLRIESEELWSGREDEIIQRFRERWPPRDINDDVNGGRQRGTLEGSGGP
jgi:hypothetical protein